MNSDEADDPVDDLLTEVLGFCGCGRPEDVACWIWKGLELLDDLIQGRPKGCVESNEAGRIRYDAWSARCDAHFGSAGAREFFWYWLDAKGFTEHGGSVPGWFTPEGDALLSELQRISAQMEWKR